VVGPTFELGENVAQAVRQRKDEKARNLFFMKEIVGWEILGRKKSIKILTRHSNSLAFYKTIQTTSEFIVTKPAMIRIKNYNR
jgi:hypothetical protein